MGGMAEEMAVKQSDERTMALPGYDQMRDETLRRTCRHAQQVDIKITISF